MVKFPVKKKEVKVEKKVESKEPVMNIPDAKGDNLNKEHTSLKVE